MMLYVSFEEIGFSLGECVVYCKFGEGIVLNYEGSGEYGCV